ncbi:MAG: ankyrin repeat domain-containing protein [Eubacterium sp.]|nr:ankyrin repeat domain-containing protein [Eubacterium sp.]
MFLDRLKRNEMFYKIAHINMCNDKEKLYKELYKIKNPNFQDLHGTSYLHVACQAHSIEAISILLEIGADPNINDNRGFSPVMSALGVLDDNNIKILEIMLNNGLDLNKQEGMDQKTTLRDKIVDLRDKELKEVLKKY